MHRLLAPALLLCVALLAGCTGSVSDGAQSSDDDASRIPVMVPGALGEVRVGDSVDAALDTGLFGRAPQPCETQRLDLIDGGPDEPSLLLDQDGRRIVLIRAGSTGRTSQGVGVGSTIEQLQDAYGADLLATEITGSSQYVKVVDGRSIMQLNLRDGVVRTMYTYSVDDWSNLAPGRPSSPQVYLDGLGGQC